MRNEIALELKKDAVKILRLVIPQQILTFVMTNIVFDNSTDRAKPLSICQVAKGKNRVRYYKVKMINKFSHFLNED